MDPSLKKTSKRKAILIWMMHGSNGFLGHWPYAVDYTHCSIKFIPAGVELYYDGILIRFYSYADNKIICYFEENDIEVNSATDLVDPFHLEVLSIVVKFGDTYAYEEEENDA